LRNAEHANAMAQRLCERLQRETKIDLVFPVEANAVFVRLPDSSARDLQARGWNFYKFLEPDVYRLMSSWATDGADIDRFVADLLDSTKRVS